MALDQDQDLVEVQEQTNGHAIPEQSPEALWVKRRRVSRSVLPTRVSSACERCRHHKSRCDPFRPCSLCIRANVDCRPISAPTQKQNSRNRKPRRRRPNPSRTTPTDETWNIDNAPQNDTESRAATAPAPAPAVDSDTAASTDMSPQSSLDCGEAESAIGIARKICELGSQHIDERTTSAIPGYRASTSAPVTYSATIGQRLPISSILGQPLPPMELVYGLLEDYFDSVHWFSLVIYEAKFRRKLASVADGFAYPSQRPFLILLTVMLGMAAWYRSQRSGTEMGNGPDWRKWSADLVKLVEGDLVELMDQPSITAAQTCILLGSYHVYHGRPNLSFSLLGATIKMSQALGMHREPLRGKFEDIEERKRVWWTIYTWDRFASITYGRPLGINDKDCNINMPADVWENQSFVLPRAEQANSICYSPYQRELNRLYLIASPALEIIFGSRTLRASNQLVGDTYAALVKEATQNLQKWRNGLPNHLVLDLQRDFHSDGGSDAKAYALQSLSLHLTYDNVLIVMHRPLLARQVDHLSTTTNGPSPGSCEIDPMTAASPKPNLSQTASSELWMNAAVRTSRVTELPVLAQLATDSHLVAFLAINLFNAAIVLAVMALSEPLSNTAQDVKRTITRILRLQDLLGKRSALSKQSTTVLKNVVTMLLRRESAAMLAPITGTNQSMGQQGDKNKQNLGDPCCMSVEDTLRLPLDASLELSDPLAGSQGWLDVSRAHRLNESLTSVQCVMAPGDVNVPVQSEQQYVSSEQMQPQSVWQVPAEYEWNGTGTSPRGVEDSYRDVESGLYWLWDMTWNGTGG
ncbi:uncharacterized protein EURHEDRAFT_378109 [Aspergillus ruber CBS 135680]|uniref:Zn(2)-C6 fungal-type domain-containing protein n=1 Tax=Aspergillus ruber (strain CBS 135680) TaxID=1388766 RepID=A0A017SC93_ASPRC|nr:uncharacterized protein EURHEDRAFT_378109 [Aspergillus ruber CBS 135680]EYE94653.1 hypothetical protein EURHEDRAFT_378109 [Aspergillus ruber CBS 135680]